MHFVLHRVVSTTEQVDLDNVEEAEEEVAPTASAGSVLPLLAALRKVCNSSSLVPDGNQSENSTFAMRGIGTTGTDTSVKLLVCNALHIIYKLYLCVVCSTNF